MDFNYSELVNPVLYESEGLCEGISLRKHKNVPSEVKGALRAQRDWSKQVVPVENYHGGLGPKFSFICVTVPECLPERLEIISYANEYAFLYDDVMEQIDSAEHDEATAHLLDVFNEKAQKADFNEFENGAKQLQQQILMEMMSIDKERAIVSMKAWSTFIQLASSRERTEPFSSLEEYLPYRIIDAGEMIWFGTVTFAMALSIPEHEMDLCKQLTRPAFAAISLTNDLYSWEKEYQDAKRDGMPHVVNGIWVLMQELSVSELKAKEICRLKIQEYVSDYLTVMQETRLNEAISTDLKKYVEALQYSLSGNLVWSIYCPRYAYQNTAKRVTTLRCAETSQRPDRVLTEARPVLLGRAYTH